MEHIAVDAWILWKLYVAFQQGLCATYRRFQLGDLLLCIRKTGHQIRLLTAENTESANHFVGYALYVVVKWHLEPR
jgi:hypothetical protein